ncbi:MAG: flagellar basal-body rod protein FlgG [Dasania sp.]|jgi:flagellar basal-body rod protein FlgG
MRALGIAASGMQAQQTRVDVISNNIANMSTTAYNARRAEFADLMYQQLERPGSISSDQGTQLPTGVQIGLGVRTVAVSMNHQQGNLIETGGELDMAIEGDGYFEVELPDGRSAYTRDGSFKRSAEGLVVTNEGYPLVPNIAIPQNVQSISMNPNGEVYANFNAQTEAQLLGTVTLTNFVNEKGLEAIGDNKFLESEASGQPLTGVPAIDGRGSIRQRYLESSSANIVEQLTFLIEAQRGYEMNAKVITASDQMMSTTSQIR